MLKIGFLGDTCFSGAFSTRNSWIDDICFQQIRQKLKNNHYNVLNLEGPLTDKASCKKLGTCLKSSPYHAVLLDQLRAKILCLANNHIMDSGVEGFQDTISVARRYGWKHFGAGFNLGEASTAITLTKDNIKVALLGVCHEEGMVAKADVPGVFSDSAKRLIKKKLRYLHQTHDWVILSYHGGEEYTQLPMPGRIKKLRKYLSWGAHIIIAHHSHVVQGFEIIQEKAIFYSLGNFVFDIEAHRGHVGTDQSVIINLTITKTSFRFSPLFTKIDALHGTVCGMQQNPHFKEIPTRQYRRKWQAECYRTFVSPRVDRTPYSSDAAGGINRSAHGTSRSLHFRSLLRVQTYLAAMRMLLGRNSRPVFSGAILWALRRRLFPT